MIKTEIIGGKRWWDWGWRGWKMFGIFYNFFGGGKHWNEGRVWGFVTGKKIIVYYECRQGTSPSSPRVLWYTTTPRAKGCGRHRRIDNLAISSWFATKNPCWGIPVLTGKDLNSHAVLTRGLRAEWRYNLTKIKWMTILFVHGFHRLRSFWSGPKGPKRPPETKFPGLSFIPPGF